MKHSQGASELAGVVVSVVLLSTVPQVSGFTDDFTDNSYTQAHWTFFDAYKGPVIRPTTATAGDGQLAVSALELPDGHGSWYHSAMAHVNADFDGPYTRVRGALVWSPEEYALRLRKQLFIAGNITSKNVHFIDLQPSRPSGTGGHFSLRRVVNGYEYTTKTADGPSPVSQSGVGTVFQVELGQFGNFLWAKLWTDDYAEPIAELSAHNSSIPWGLGDGNTLSGFGAMLDVGETAYEGAFTSVLLPNALSGSFEVATAPDGPGVAGEEDEAPVSAGTDQTVAVLGDPGEPGWIEATFEHTTVGGGFSAAYVALRPEDLPIADFTIPGDTMQAWEMDFDGEFEGSVDLVFTYDDTDLLLEEELLLSIFHYEGDEWVQLDGIVDTVGNTISVTTTSFSPFALGVVPEPATLALLSVGLLGLRRRLSA